MASKVIAGSSDYILNYGSGNKSKQILVNPIRQLSSSKEKAVAILRTINSNGIVTDWLQISSISFAAPIKKGVPNSITITFKNINSDTSDYTIYLYKMGLLYTTDEVSDIDINNALIGNSNQPNIAGYNYLVWGKTKPNTIYDDVYEAGTFLSEKIEYTKTVTKTIAFTPNWEGTIKDMKVLFGFKHTEGSSNETFSGVGVFSLGMAKQNLTNYKLITDLEVTLNKLVAEKVSETRKSATDTRFDLTFKYAVEYGIGEKDPNDTYSNEKILIHLYKDNKEQKRTWNESADEYEYEDVQTADASTWVSTIEKLINLSEENPYSYNETCLIKDVGKNVTIGVQYYYEKGDKTFITQEVQTNLEVLQSIHLHLSGVTDANDIPVGGVAVGGYSTVTIDSGAKFECFYPAYFMNGFGLTNCAKLTYADGFKAYSNDHEPYVTKIGSLIFLDGMIGTTAENATSSAVVAAYLPEWARPRVRLNYLMQGSTSHVFWLQIMPSGAIQIVRYRNTATSSSTTSYLSIGKNGDNTQLPVNACWVSADAYVGVIDET